MDIQMIVCITIVFIVLAAAIMVVLWYRQSVKKTMQIVLNRINEAIAGNYSETKYDESMMSAIEERLNQFLTISQETKQITTKERDTIKSLVSDISHQTRIPLSNILLYSQLLEEKQNLPEDISGIVKQIQNQADKLDFLIKALVKSSYLENELISIAAVPERIDKLVLLSCQEVEMQALQKEMVIEYEECGLSCSFDLKWTLEAVSNILENAVKYSPAQSKVVIKVQAYEMFYRIDIQNSGMGISEEEQGLIFQRFYRSPKVQKEKGLGIGLYLAREIIIRQGGYIKVKSEPGSGALFSIFLSHK
ncbi:sensor histidine kinase [Robinsoniella peoriensis]|uniref:sensor histidine kinase n=1 Tax=Robinsoniella peoriensis TaxID=180332 RepID=UPI000693A3EB|nr:HAMP domain-containing sensor histidine kinase [Robinsoniella peoriensis]